MSILLKQLQASNPNTSVWVSASAGTGKTKVLTDRVLRLLISGALPQRILCLTFTKAAAAEMHNRLIERLSHWMLASKDVLIQELTTLNQAPPSESQVTRARALFTEVLDSPGGMKIQTIHGFCQSILKRFPLEAGLLPHFEIADEAETKSLLERAQGEVLEGLSQDHPSKKTILETLSYTKFQEIMSQMVSQRSYGKRQFGNARTYTHAFKIDEDLDALESQIIPHPLPEALEEAFHALCNYGTPTDQARGRSALEAWGQSSSQDYKDQFLTATGERRKRLVTKSCLEKAPMIEAVLIQEAERLEELDQRIKALKIAHLSGALGDIGGRVLDRFQELKTTRGLLDYQDLIDHTQELLKHPHMAPWVLYKLDGGIDHILVDEAQDTNHAQWSVITSLAQEFFGGLGAGDQNRTLFVVGDGKQSIYSFQGANPHMFGSVKDQFRQWIQESDARGEGWQEIELDTSFRSTPAVLKVVDQVFTNTKGKTGVVPMEETLQHRPHRSTHPGKVVVMPLHKPDLSPEDTSWAPPSRIQNTLESPRVKTARALGNRIGDWLHSGRILRSKNRPVTPGDILVLVRTRGSFMEEIVRSLKEHNIPVSGVDLMILHEQIAVQDLVALGTFCLFSKDDLTLGEILKSPLFGVTEEDLYALCQGRTRGSLWQELRQRSFEGPTTRWGEVYRELKTYRKEARDYRPFEFYSSVLSIHGGRSKFQSRLGTEVLDPLEEFLTLALTFEEDQTPTLQGFLDWFSQNPLEIKRDLSQGSQNQVRVMTVHGSKGLQAPIVILPDGASLPRASSDLLWTGDHLMICPPSTSDIPLTRSLKAARRTQDMEEYNRLLYVALTRAEDELYMGGFVDQEQVPEDSWYGHVQQALFDLGAQEGEEGLIYEDPYEETSLQEITTQQSSIFVGLPLWIGEKIHPLPGGLTLITPSKLDTFDFSTRGGTYAMDPALRGDLIHRLLHFLPRLPRENWDQGVNHLLKPILKPSGLEKSLQEEIKIHTYRVLDHGDFQDLWGPNSRGEVSVAGVHGEKGLIRGRLDRLVVEEGRVHIIDFKTTQTPPDILPQSYARQLELYGEALKPLYPHHEILGSILWTETLTLQEVFRWTYSTVTDLAKLRG